MISYDQLFQSNLTPKTGYTLSNGVNVMPATSGVNNAQGQWQAQPVNGQSYGGEGMQMPAGATANKTPAMGYAGVATSLISGLADAYNQYAAASAIKAPTITPDYKPVAFQPQTAQLPLANIGARNPTQG